MRAKFIHDAIDGVCHAFETAFPAGKWVNVDHLTAEHQNKLAANPTFETSGDPDPLPSPTVVEVKVETDGDATTKVQPAVDKSLS